MLGRIVDLKLIPLNGNVVKNGGFKAVLNKSKDSAMSYDEVLEEIIEKNRLGMSKSQVRMILDMAFETVAEGVLTDGKSRRFGDYLQVGLEVKGRFVSEGDQFDEDRHQLSLAVRALKEFRRAPGRDGVRVVNRNAGPKVALESMHSVGCEPGVLAWGADVVIEGENLHVCDDGSDEFQVKYFGQHGSWYPGDGFLVPSWVSPDGKKAVIPWSSLNLDQFKKESFGMPQGVMIGYMSRGGRATAKSQLHRAKAYFDVWLDQHPESKGDLGKLRWGPKK